MTELSPYSTHEFSVDGNNDSWSNLFAFVPPDSRVLDVGCSTGNFGEALEKIKDCTVVGVDLSEADIAIARTRISEARVLDITRPGALATLGIFDVIVFADVLEHLVDPYSALTASAKQLAEEGSVLYSIPNMAHLSVRIDLLEGRFGYTEVGILDKTHVHFYDRQAVDELFADAGLDIVAEHSVSIEYPAGWIETRLTSNGLTGSDKFDEMLQTSDAAVLQFVGQAVRGRRGPSEKPTVRVRTFPPEEINAYVQSLEAENRWLRDESRVESRLAEANLRADSAENQLMEVTARLSYVRRHPVRALLGFVWRRIRS